MFDGPCRCDVILGRDFLHKSGLQLNFDRQTVQWLDQTIDMKGDAFMKNPQLFFLEDQHNDELEEELESNATEILDAKCERVDPREVADKQTHLTPQQRMDLSNLLSKHAKLFNGELGRYPHRKIHLEIDPEAIPVHHRACPVPRAHEDVFKKELDHLVAKGVS